MSNYAISSVMAKSKSSGTARLVLIIMADYAAEDGTAWPSTTNIAKKANTTKRNVIKILSRLESDGEISRIGFATRKVIKYKITVVTSELPDTGARTDTSEPQDTRTGERTDTRTGERTDTQSLTNPLLTPYDNNSAKHKSKKVSLPKDWKPSEKDIQFAKEKGWRDPEIRKEVDKFVVYWTKGNGAGKKRENWSRSWITWVNNNYSKIKSAQEKVKITIAKPLPEADPFAGWN